MTYKELLFKMGEKGMLTLSNEKDGRGLFWAGMDNMEMLEKEFNWKDLEGDPPPKTEYYLDRQGKKTKKHKNCIYEQPFFSESRKSIYR